MMTKDELLEAVRTSTLSENDIMEVVRVLLEKLMGETMLQAGMDLISGRGTDDAPTE